jgi:stage II sporulation protein D
MFTSEPLLRVGIIDGSPEIQGEARGTFRIGEGVRFSGLFTVRQAEKDLEMADHMGHVIARGSDLLCEPVGGSTFLLKAVTIGVSFHWERKEDQLFEGSLRLIRRPDGGIVAINEILLEAYLRSVISSEMSAEASGEFLKAHAITSRSWLAAMLERMKRAAPPIVSQTASGSEIVRWYTREDHDLYDVCADDHCQRYQGITKVFTETAELAVSSTRGLFLTYAEEICDARFYKACGGLTEEFQFAWEDTAIPYLRCVADSPVQHSPLVTEADAERWILSRPEAYCDSTDTDFLKKILPSFDQETTDFYRWTVEYRREELEKIIQKKSGMDFGTLLDLVPLGRGPSGRLHRLRVIGSQRDVVVGKELEIRRWLSPSHLYSSAFVVRMDRDAGGIPTMVRLHGAGWGHGVGLCQIGAAAMTDRGFTAEKTVLHYFRDAQLRKLY